MALNFWPKDSRNTFRPLCAASRTGRHPYAFFGALDYAVIGRKL